MALGAALVLSGIVYFFAYNWSAMTRFDKFGLVELGLVLCAAGAGYFGLQSNAGKTSLMGGSVMVGVFLVVFSQAYQTGADAWQLFAAWMGLILPWVLISNFAGLWIFWLVLLNVTVGFFCTQRDVTDDFELITLLGTLNACALMLRELGSLKLGWLRGRWHRQLMLCTTLLLLHIPATVWTIDSGTADPGSGAGMFAYWTVVALAFYYYINKAPDLLALSLVALSICGQILGFLGNLWFDGPESAFTFLSFGFVVLGVFFGALQVLRFISRYHMPAPVSPSPAGASEDKSATETGTAEATGAGSTTPDDATEHEQAPPPSLGATLQHLLEQKLVSVETVADSRQRLQAEATAPTQPWYFQALAGLGAWLAASFFFSFIGALGIVDGEPTTLFLLGVVCTAGGLLLRPKEAHTFQRQFALAVGITGKLMVMGSFAVWMDDWLGWLLGSALVMAVVYPISKDAADRFVMSASTFALALSWMMVEKHYGYFSLYLVALMGVVIATFTLPHALRALRPMGYAAAVSALLTLIAPLLARWYEVPSDTLAHVVVLFGLIGIYAWAAGGVAHLKSEPLLVAVGATLLFGVVAPSGLLAAIAILVLGFGLHDRVLTTLALIFLPIFFIMFYYELEVTLFSKAWVLIGSGLVLLVARGMLATRSWAREVV